MSLATRCPACGTTFKVVRDQLRISDGWVRCGRCSEVFDATIELQQTPDAPAAPSSPAAPSAPATRDSDETPRDIAADNEPAAEPDERPGPPVEPAAPFDAPTGEVSEADFLDDDGDSSFAALEPRPSAPAHDEARAAATTVASMPWPDASLLSLGDEGRAVTRPPAPPPLAFPDLDLSLSLAPAPAHALEVQPSDGANAAAAAPADDSDLVQFQKALRRARAKSAKIAKAMKSREQKAAAADTAPVVLAASEPEPAVADATTMPSLFADEKKDGFWQRVAVRRSMVALAILAALLLVGQVVYQERDLIAARQPGLRPALDSMCRVLGCEVSALRQINDIKVDGASFSREKNDDGYRLSFTLRNAADVPLAMPAVELSLLDTQERAVVRRVLMPSDFGAPSVLPARSERSASLSLRLTGPEAAAMPPVAGFRVETLYP
jgi:predicted Zn finger-like uncharacterized protein